MALGEEGNYLTELAGCLSLNTKLNKDIFVVLWGHVERTHTHTHTVRGNIKYTYMVFSTVCVILFTQSSSQHVLTKPGHITTDCVCSVGLTLFNVSFTISRQLCPVDAKTKEVEKKNTKRGGTDSEFQQKKGEKIFLMWWGEEKLTEKWKKRRYKEKM